MYENIGSPLRYYVDRGEQTHKENVDAFFDILKGHAHVDEEQNAKTVAKYNEKQAEIASLQGQISSSRKGRGWGIFGIIVLAIVLMVVFNAMGIPPAGVSALCALTLVGAIVAIVLVCKKAGAKIRSMQTVADGLQAQANALQEQAFQQVLPILQLFTDFDGIKLVEKTFPHLAFDSFFSRERLEELQTFGYNADVPSNQCTVDVLSGALYGAPLLIERRVAHQKGTKTYRGSLNISWQESYTDSNGNRQTRTRSQTLYATVTKFAPYYTDIVKLHYGQDVKPELSFSRTGKDVHRKDEDDLERTLRSGEKKLQRKHDKELKKGGDFTPLANTKFEVLFGATDRTDEIAFRYLFPFQAQESMLELILSNKGYGDDFDFYKYGKLNTIISDHAQYSSVFPKVYEYVSHDFKEIESKFKERNYAFFKGLFFDIAPLIAIPSYQQPLAQSTAKKDGELTPHVYQIMARLLGKKTKPSNAETQVIYRTCLRNRADGADIVETNAFAYRTENRTDYVSVLGGDGFHHNVPVDWIEYIPTERTTTMKVQRLDEDQEGTSYLGVSASIVS
ncbi:MAG: hypothetical protein IJ996_00670 [Clostridia bacterium]|nr:hypothetical protein [Clostridia bacterium]